MLKKTTKQKRNNQQNDSSNIKGKHIQLAEKLHKFIKTNENKQSNLTKKDKKAINGEISLLDLDLRYVTKEDFHYIMELERANNRNEKDNMLIFIVQETLRVNNHIIKFLNGVGKVIVNNKGEQEFLDLFDSANDFSFRSIDKTHEIDNEFTTFKLLIHLKKIKKHYKIKNQTKKKS